VKIMKNSPFEEQYHLD